MKWLLRDIYVPYGFYNKLPWISIGVGLGGAMCTIHSSLLIVSLLVALYGAVVLWFRG